MHMINNEDRQFDLADLIYDYAYSNSKDISRGVTPKYYLHLDEEEILIYDYTGDFHRLQCDAYEQDLEVFIYFIEYLTMLQGIPSFLNTLDSKEEPTYKSILENIENTINNFTQDIEFKVVKGGI